MDSTKWTQMQKLYRNSRDLLHLEVINLLLLLEQLQQKKKSVVAHSQFFAHDRPPLQTSNVYVTAGVIMDKLFDTDEVLFSINEDKISWLSDKIPFYPETHFLCIATLCISIKFHCPSMSETLFLDAMFFHNPPDWNLHIKRKELIEIMVEMERAVLNAIQYNLKHKVFGFDVEVQLQEQFIKTYGTTDDEELEKASDVACMCVFKNEYHHGARLLEQCVNIGAGWQPDTFGCAENGLASVLYTHWKTPSFDQSIQLSKHMADSRARFVETNTLGAEDSKSYLSKLLELYQHKHTPVCLYDFYIEIQALEHGTKQKYICIEKNTNKLKDGQQVQKKNKILEAVPPDLLWPPAKIKRMLEAVPPEHSWTPAKMRRRLPFAPSSPPQSPQPPLGSSDHPPKSFEPKNPPHIYLTPKTLKRVCYATH